MGLFRRYNPPDYQHTAMEALHRQKELERELQFARETILILNERLAYEAGASDLLVFLTQRMKPKPTDFGFVIEFSEREIAFDTRLHSMFKRILNRIQPTAPGFKANRQHERNDTDDHVR